MAKRPLRRGAIFLAAVLSSVCAFGGERENPSRLTVAGAPSEIGRAIGEKHGEFIRAHHPVFLGLASLMTGKPKADLYARASEISSRMADDDLAEIRGIADGAGMPFEDALFLNLFYELSGFRLACRQLVAWGEATVSGELIHARNLDWFDFPGGPLKGRNIILNLKPDDGLEYLLLTWPGFQGALTGVNRKGLTLAFNELTVRESPDYVAEPAFFAMKRALRTCETVEQAIQLLKEARPMGSGSIMVSDATAKTAAVVEIHAGQFGVRRPRLDMIGNANHATDAGGLDGPLVYPEEWPTCAVAREIGLPLTVDKARRVMADRRVLQSINILSVIFLPQRNTMRLSCGRNRAALGGFESYKLFDDNEQDAGD